MRLLFQTALAQIELAISHQDKKMKEGLLREVSQISILLLTFKAQGHLSKVWKQEAHKLISFVVEMIPTIDLSMHKDDVDRVHTRAQVIFHNDLHTHDSFSLFGKPQIRSL